jgi:ribosomal protein L29
MKVKDLAEKSDKELQQLIRQLEQQLGEAAVELRTKKVTNVKRTHNLKLAKARALTVARQRALTKEENNG